MVEVKELDIHQIYEEMKQHGLTEECLEVLGAKNMRDDHKADCRFSSFMGMLEYIKDNDLDEWVLSQLNVLIEDYHFSLEFIAYLTRLEAADLQTLKSMDSSMKYRLATTVMYLYNAVLQLKRL